MLTHVLKHPAVLATLILLATLTFLPIPSRAAESSNTEIQVQFPASSPACVACQPAFSSPACQTILDSIASSSSGSLSNSTLATCQCRGSFLSLYSSCVKCFTETNQVSLVFGSSQAPTQPSLEAYCKSISPSAQGGASATVTITKTTTSTVTGSPTASPTRPSSAMSLTKAVQSGLGYYTVLAVACLAFFSLLP
ncbi:hypothetical protein BG015_009046 [Linnemannia schmuckeri]|uniref:Uncharacterized protein n=1 Tax=Linnemannia schmuckeri TaxID=64567 RepID=A0A9P5RZK1_9FUNG|nr:hypothetical protein BG015_009046 [Linnemannia schmuckeri]